MEPLIEQVEVKRKPIVGGRPPGRNQPCPCNSGLKYSDCHGDHAKIAQVQHFAQQLMLRMIQAERMKKDIIPFPWTCKECGKGFLKPKQITRSVLAPGMSPNAIACPHCESVDIEQTELPEPEAKELPVVEDSE